ncbi:hypothetical protein QQM41_03015 [Acetobacter sp. AC2005]|uniref:hypothetical protein n=1 Tax=Acetobacter sp. AC2005 TaxID=3134142 RepID=UPI0030D61D6F
MSSTNNIVVSNGVTDQVYDNNKGSYRWGNYLGNSVNNAQVNGGGKLDIGSGGTVNHVAALGSAGYYGGSASFATISTNGNGGSAVVENYTISNYALAYASSGGELTNGSINGGTAEIGNGGLIANTNIYGSGNYSNTAIQQPPTEHRTM